MKKRISIVLGGLGLCALVFVVASSDVSAKKKASCENACKFNGSDCKPATMGCFCGSTCEQE